MTPVLLMEDLANELKEILSHLQFPDEMTGDITGINVFQFGLPMEKTAEDKKRRFPYVLILPDEGDIEDASSPQQVRVQMLIGVFDRDAENQGKKHVLNIINDICERFLTNPVLNGKYYADEKITWVVDKEDEYPYHYGAVWIMFNTPTFRREDEYA